MSVDSKALVEGLIAERKRLLESSIGKGVDSFWVFERVSEIDLILSSRLNLMYYLFIAQARKRK